DNRLDGFKYALAVVLGQAVAQASLGIDIRGLVVPVFDAGIRIVCTVRGSGVNRPCALLERCIIGENSQDLAIQKCMLEGCAFQFASRQARYDTTVLQSSVLPPRFEDPFSDDRNVSCVF